MNTRNTMSGRITRRQLLSAGAVAGMGVLMAGCQPKVVEKTVEKTVEVQKEVTKIVQQVVTPTPAPAKKIKMTFFVNWGGSYGKKNEEVAQLYMSKTPNVEIETLIGRDQAAVQTAIAGGTPPTVSHLFWAWGRLFITQDALLDLSPYLDKGKGTTRANFDAAWWSFCESRGKAYMVPYFQGGVRHALFWNKNLFEAAGLDPEKPPKDVAELVSMGEKLTKFDKSGNIEVLGYNSREFAPLNYWAPFVGADLYDPVRRVFQHNQAPFVDVLTKLADYTRKIGFDKMSAWSEAINNQKVDPFAVEKQAIVVGSGDWANADIRDGNPKLEGHYGVTWAPSSVGKKAILAYTHAMLIPKDSPEKEAAWAFVDWACGSDDVCNKAYKETGSVAPWKPWRDKQDWKAADKLPFTSWFIDSIKNADYAGPEMNPELLGLLGQEPEKRYQSAEQAVLMGELKPVDALQRLDKELQPLLDQAIRQYKL